VGWLDVQKALRADEAAVEMVRFRLFQQGVLSDSVLYAALLVKPTTKKTPELLVLSNGKRMEKQYLAYYRNVTKNQREDDYSYSVFWKPIEERLENFTQIYLSPDGVYNQVNVEAFLVEGNTYVIDKYNVMLVSNTKDVALAAQRTEKIAKGQMTAPVIEDKALLVGNPAFYEAMATGKLDKKQLQESMRGGAYIDELPGTAIEINEIERLLKQAGWQIQKLEEVNASEEKLKTIQNPRVFHIATHGFFLSNSEKQNATTNNIAQNPLLRSGLLLEGAGDVLAKSSMNFNLEPGVLTAAEAMNLQLDNTELVILSACETGLGDIQFGEGVFGLQRSFLVAGASLLVMSLFKVSDEVTQKLMVQFYQRWLQSGDKRQAFREAKLAIKTEFPQPRFWGAFNMIGSE
jgi:CHAT domain-containing protein